MNIKTVAGITAVGLMIGVSSAHANDTLSKTKESGRIVLGVRDAGPPLSYAAVPGQYAGYHVELCQGIVEDIAKASGKEITIDYQLVTSTNRIPLLQNGTIDLECGTTTNTTARQADVSFALTTYVTEMRVVTRKDSGITAVEQLNGRNVATTAGSTGGIALREYLKRSGHTVNELTGKDHSNSFLLLQNGRVDAFIVDDMIGAGNVALARDPSQFALVGAPLSVEPIAIMLRKDDADFKKTVDASIRSRMESGELAKLYDKWFLNAIPPRNTVVNLPLGQTLQGLFKEPNDKPIEAYKAAL